MVRAILAALAVSLALAGTAAPAAAQWPMSCVELNDLFERGLENFHNVGIYQRVHGELAEQACRSDHGHDARRGFAWAFPQTARTDSMSCVELNDLFEHHLGNFHNVGIYQYVHGELAEQACRNDHLRNARQGFAWAFPQPACTDGTRPLNYGFYAYFEPISYSADPDPDAAGFSQHRGYEADLLNALEAMDGAGLSFVRHPIPTWADDDFRIWLAPAGEQFDMVGGGITILDARTRGASGETAIRFTSGHVTFRQSLLVRAADAERITSHDDLTSSHRVGVLPGTTGEGRLLQLTGLADAAGVLTAGTRIHTSVGELVADGTDAYTITSARGSTGLEQRLRLTPPGPDMPQVIYLGTQLGDVELLEALREGRIDAVARGEIGNRDFAHGEGGAFVVTALDPAVEYGGFSLSADDAELAACIDAKLDWLTDNRRIGYAQWREDPMVFLRRALTWGA